MSVDGADRDVRGYLETAGWNGVAVHDHERKLANEFATCVYPTTVFLNPEGRVVVFTDGGVPCIQMIGAREWDSPKFAAFLASIAKLAQR